MTLKNSILNKGKLHVNEKAEIAKKKKKMILEKNKIFNLIYFYLASAIIFKHVSSLKIIEHECLMPLSIPNNQELIEK